MTLIQIETGEIYFGIKNDVATVCFSDNSGGEDKYIMLSRNLTPNEQDINFGHNHVYAEINDQQHSKYGGIVAAKLYPIKLELDLSPDLLDATGHHNLCLKFSLETDRNQQFQSIIKAIFDKHSNFTCSI